MKQEIEGNADRVRGGVDSGIGGELPISRRVPSADRIPDAASRQVTARDPEAETDGNAVSQPDGGNLGKAGAEPFEDCPAAPESVAEDPVAEAPSIADLTADIVAALKTVYDPEIPVDIYELGLIYRVDVSDTVVAGRRDAAVEMTLTAPGCPVADWLVSETARVVGGVEGIADVQVNLVFDPPWDPSLMSDEARFSLNMF